MKKLVLLAALAMIVPFTGEAQGTRAPRSEARPRLVLRELNVGLAQPPDPDFPPDPCVVARVSLAAVVGREARLYHPGVITIEGTIEDEDTGLVRGRVGTRGKGGEGILAGLISGQPREIDPCWDVAAVLTNFRTGEVLDRQLYHADPVR
jgi:hypothetical protein